MIIRDHEQLMEQINNDLLPVMDKIGAKVQKKIKFHITKLYISPIQNMLENMKDKAKTEVL